MSDNQQITHIVKGLLRQLGTADLTAEVQVLQGDGIWHRPEGTAENVTVVAIAPEGSNLGATIIISHKKASSSYNGGREKDSLSVADYQHSGV